MKKFKHILVCGLAVVASAVAVQAQTLTQDWKVTQGLPVANDARWGVGFGGKVFVNDMTAQKIATFDGTNKNTLGVSRNLVGINFRHPNVMPNFAVWKTITYRHWHRWCCQPRF